MKQMLLVLVVGLIMGADDKKAVDQFKGTWNGFVAAFADLGPALAARSDIRARRRISMFRLAAALTWNPFAYLGRQIDIRPFALLAASVAEATEPATEPDKAR